MWQNRFVNGGMWDKKRRDEHVGQVWLQEDQIGSGETEQEAEQYSGIHGPYVKTADSFQHLNYLITELTLLQPKEVNHSFASSYGSSDNHIFRKHERKFKCW